MFKIQEPRTKKLRTKVRRLSLALGSRPLVLGSAVHSMINWRPQHILAPYTSWRIGGPAAMLVEATTADEVREALTWAQQRNI